jgi:hypothetical protein
MVQIGCGRVAAKRTLFTLVKFQQRYQMRNRTLSKAVPAWEFCAFCNAEK